MRSSENANNQWRQKENESPLMLKDWRKVYRNLREMHWMDEHEKVLYARSLAATPDERWQMNVVFLRSLGLWGRSSLKRFGSNS